MMTRPDSISSLFIQALNVTNAAMEANCRSPVLEPTLSACAADLAGEDFAVAIYDDDPNRPVDFFTIRLVAAAFVLVSHSFRPTGETVWNVSTDYLRDVVARPRRYVDDPRLLALDWLKRRLELVA